MRANLEGGGFIDFPIDLDRLKFGQYTDFKACEAQFFESNSVLPEGVDPDEFDEDELEELKQLIIDDNTATEHLIEAVSYLVEGDVDLLDFSLPGDKLDELIDGGYIIKPGDDISTLRVYAHIITLINAYHEDKDKAVDKDFSLEWKGETYYIQSEAISKQLQNVTMTNGEVLTILELNRLADRKLQKYGDLDGNIEFNMGLEEVAILLRKKDERLPVNRRKRIRFIDERKKVFEDIPLTTALGISFFLARTLIKSVQTHVTNSFSKGPPKSVRNKKKKGKRKRKRG